MQTWQTAPGTHSCPELQLSRRVSSQPPPLESSPDRPVVSPLSIIMRFAALVIGILAALVSTVTATALTYRLEANEKACFYNYVDERNTKVAFYFAVSADAMMKAFLCYKIYTVRTNFPRRSNLAVLSTSITPLLVPAIRWSWMERRNDRAISSLRLRA